MEAGQVFGAELYALYQASKTLDNRNERGQDYSGDCHHRGVQSHGQPGEYPDAKMGP